MGGNNLLCLDNKIRLGNMVFCSSGRLPSQVHNYWDFPSLKKWSLQMTVLLWLLLFTYNWFELPGTHTETVFDVASQTVWTTQRPMRRFSTLRYTSTSTYVRYDILSFDNLEWKIYCNVNSNVVYVSLPEYYNRTTFYFFIWINYSLVLYDCEWMGECELWVFHFVFKPKKLAQVECVWDATGFSLSVAQYSWWHKLQISIIQAFLQDTLSFAQ